MNAEAQKAMADKDGVKKLARYSELKDAVRDMRTGDLLWVGDLTVLADNRDGLLRVLREFSTAKYPVGIHEGRTGRVSLPPHDGQHMAIEALARWSSANKRFGVLTADEAGERGGKKTRKGRRDKMLPVVKAGAMWFDHALWHLDTDSITAEINKVGRALGFKRAWSKDALYREFGKRGVPAGPKINLQK